MKQYRFEEIPKPTEISHHFRPWGAVTLMHQLPVKACDEATMVAGG